MHLSHRATSQLTSRHSCFRESWAHGKSKQPRAPIVQLSRASIKNSNAVSLHVSEGKEMKIWAQVKQCVYRTVDYMQHWAISHSAIHLDIYIILQILRSKAKYRAFKLYIFFHNACFLGIKLMTLTLLFQYRSRSWTSLKHRGRA